MKISFYRLADTRSGNEKLWTAKISKARLRLIKRAARKSYRPFSGTYGTGLPTTHGQMIEIPATFYSYYIVDKRNGFWGIRNGWGY